MSNWLVCKFSSKSDNILVLGPICPNQVLNKNREMSLFDLYSTPSEALSVNFQANLSKFQFWDQFAQIQNYV